MDVDSDRSLRDQIVVAPPPELDLSTRSSLQALLVDAVAQRPAVVVVDLNAVTFLDSGAVDLVVAAARELSSFGGMLRVRKPPRTYLRSAWALDNVEALALVERADH